MIGAKNSLVRIRKISTKPGFISRNPDEFDEEVELVNPISESFPIIIWENNKKNQRCRFCFTQDVEKIKEIREGVYLVQTLTSVYWVYVAQ